MGVKTGLFITALFLFCISVQSQDFQYNSNFKNLEEDEDRLLFQSKKIIDQRFVEIVGKPLWSRHIWSTSPPEGKQYADLSAGIIINAKFPDPEGYLETAYSDLNDFFIAGNINTKNSKYIIETLKVANLKNEAFRIEIDEKVCRILAMDIEGIRRGIFCIEDEILKANGPFLPLGIIEREPLIQRRISRCFFGPIKRPGNLKGLVVGDELLDEFDYYPDQYLNRLAHEGVNGLWVTLSSKMGDGSSVGFGDLVSTTITPNEGINGEKRLSKLRYIVKKCSRYGIRIYIKTMEPHVPASIINDSILKAHPNILGNNNQFLCASNEYGQQYLYEAANKIFRAVPELGGIINISHGELYTSCLSALSAVGGGQINCPTCSKIPPWKILHNSLSAMKRGMQEISPDAELISWLYMPQPQTQDMSHVLADWVYTIPAHTPEGVILQFNFESGVKKTVFGKELIGGDYWIATPGPSSRFERVAEIAEKNGTTVSAKIQTGGSYSVATVPYVPVPSLIYQKFLAMKRLGVTHTMLNWIVGASPGLMNKAAGLLSFEPFPENEDDFLIQLASIYWKREDIPQVITAWKCFSEGYRHYPLDNKFQYFGPMNDGTTWPLLLEPMDSPLSPTYQLGDRVTGKLWPPSGDRIGECFPENLTFEEMIELCKKLVDKWDLGVKIMNELESKYIDNHERISDIELAKTIGIQFRSGYNILRFYYLRDKMFALEDVDERLTILNQLKDIIKEEIETGKQLILLCNQNPLLGYHADAEGYKYFPEKIKWRIELLNTTLYTGVPALEEKIRNKELLYPEYTGKKLTGAVTNAVPITFQMDGNFELHDLQQFQWESLDLKDLKKVIWSTGYDDDALYILIADSITNDDYEPGSSLSTIKVRVQPRRLWPSKQLFFDLSVEKRSEDVRVKKDDESGNWITVIRIPFNKISHDIDRSHPIRMDFEVQTKNGEIATWRPNNPYLSRLILGRDNPNDLGWISFEN
ncbi:MAG: hypothetical protein ACOX19_00365 [Fermentimonas sp.]